MQADFEARAAGASQRRQVMEVTKNSAVVRARVADLVGFGCVCNLSHGMYSWGMRYGSHEP